MIWNSNINLFILAESKPHSPFLTSQLFCCRGTLTSTTLLCFPLRSYQSTNLFLFLFLSFFSEVLLLLCYFVGLNGNTSFFTQAPNKKGHHRL